MNTKRLAAVSLAFALLGATGLSAAASPPQPVMHDHGSAMMGDGMMGKEKIAMQMHGEMMKAMGDIMLKYADKIQTPPAK
jgi:hypothetical protein